MELKGAGLPGGDQGMYRVTRVNRFIHLLPEGKRKLPFPCNRCAGPSEPSKQQIHMTREERWSRGVGVEARKTVIMKQLWVSSFMLALLCPT